MSNLGLLIAGAVVSIPAALGMAALIYAAVADGRENDRIQAEGDTDEVTER